MSDFFFFVAIIVIGTLSAQPPSLPLAVVLPEDHRAYAWVWTVEFVRIKESIAGKPQYNWREVLTSKIKETLSEQVDEKGNPIIVIGQPEIKVLDSETDQFRDWSYVTVKVKATTRFHGHFSKEPEIPALVVVTTGVVVGIIVTKVVPLVIAGIIAIIVLDKIRQIALVILDITSSYSKTETVATDDEGNVIYEEKEITHPDGTTEFVRTPIILTTEEGEPFSKWLPYIAQIILIIAVAVIVALLGPALLGGKRRK